MVIKSSAETFSEQIEEKFKVSEIKDKFQIKVSPEDIKKYGDTLLTLQEIQSIKEGNTTIAKLGLEKLRLSVDKTQSTISEYKEKIKPQELLEKSNNGLDELGDKLESEYDKVGQSETGKQLKKATNKTTDIIKKAAKSGYTVQLGEAMNDAFSKLKKFDIWGALISLFKGLFGMFVGNETLKKAGEKTKKVLDMTNPEYKETLSKTQNIVIDYLEKATGEKFSDETKDRLKRKLSPNEQDSLISTKEFEKLTKKIQSGKKIGINDLKESGIILNLIRDPDFKEIKELLSQNINKKLFTFFKTKFEKSGVVFDNNSETKLKSIIKREFQHTTANELIERTKEDGGEVHFNGLEGIESVISIGTLIPNVILEAYKENIIKVENLAIGIVESGKDTLSIGLKALDGQDIIPDLVGRMSWDNFDEKIGNIDPQKKILLERAFYSELGLVSSVLGTIGFYGTSSLVSLIEGSKSKLSGKSFSIPPVERLKNTLNIINEGNGVWLTEIENALKDTQKSYEIVNKLKKGNLDELTKQKYIDELKKISGNFSETKTGLFSPKNLSKITKNLNPLQSFHFTKSIEQLQQITKTNEQLGIAITKGTFTKEALKAKQFIESFKMRYINGRAVLNISDGLKGKEFAKAMGSLAPEIVQGLFKVAPILIVGNSIWESTKEQEGEWYETLIMLNGFVGGMQLFKDTEINYTEEGLQIKNPESFAGGMALIGMETVFFGKDLIHYVSKGQYLKAIPMAAFNSAVRLPLDAIKGIGWASVRGYESLKIAKAFLKKSPKKGRIGLGAAILLGGVLALEYASADEIDIKKLEKEGLIKNGEPNMDILKKKWPQFDIDKKEEIISLYTLSMLEKPFNGKGDKFNFKLENGIFNISIDNSLKNDKKLIQNLLENVSRFLSEINSNIKLNIKFI